MHEKKVCILLLSNILKLNVSDDVSFALSENWSVILSPTVDPDQQQAFKEYDPSGSGETTLKVIRKL
jgi:hypothetical protein